MRFRTLLAVPFVALALAGCGSSDGGSGSDATVPANATLIKAIDGIAWDAKTYTATPIDGKVIIAVENDSSVLHDLHLIDAESVDVGVDLKIDTKGSTDSTTIALPAGTYQVICTISGHANMKATLTVA